MLAQPLQEPSSRCGCFETQSACRFPPGAKSIEGGRGVNVFFLMFLNESMKRTAFKIPLQSEVQAYIKNKMGWPDRFCEHYADRFWNHYQASGWKLSSGNLIKDWQACFNSQWKTPKFKEDIEMLNRMTGKVVNGVKTPNTQAEKLDAFIDFYKTNSLKVKFEDFGAWYDYMKSEKLLRELTKKDVDQYLEIYNGDKNKCRCAVVMDTLSGYVNSGLKVTDILEMRRRLHDR